jgi:hypothetical protein
MDMRRVAPRRSVGRTAAVLATMVVLAVGACTLDDAMPPGSTTGTADGPVRYRTSGVVIDRGGGPRLCFGWGDSRPPSCDGAPLDGWNWEAVPHETAGAVRFGQYDLVVARADSRFEVAGSATEHVDTPAPQDHLLDATCPPPEGGWQWADVTDEEQEAFLAHAASLDGFAGSWLVTIGFGQGAGQRQLNIAYLDDVDVAARRADLQARWPAPICVVGRAYTLDRLEEIEGDLFAPDTGPTELFGRLGASTAFVDESRGVVDVHVVVEEPWMRSLLDERFGTGAVALTATLVPVE